jgi:hypothetical protein
MDVLSLRHGRQLGVQDLLPAMWRGAIVHEAP